MKRSGVWASLLALGMATGAMGVRGQSVQEKDALPPPSPIEKALAERATHVTEVTLDKNMLAFASKFMDKDTGKDDEEAKQMIRNLKGVYVRDYEFDKNHSYTAAELDGLRKYFESSDWSPMVRDRTKNIAEGTDVYVKLVDGQMQGLFVLDAEAKELALVLILGPIDIDRIGKLGGAFGIPRDAVKKAQKEVGK
jgi:hypothetical protein